MFREVYEDNVRLRGPKDEVTLINVYNVANSLFRLGRYEEAARTIRSHMGPTRKKLGADHHLVLRLQQFLARSTFHTATSRKQKMEALSSMQAVYERRLRVFGAAHPQTRICQEDLADIRTALAGV